MTEGESPASPAAARRRLRRALREAREAKRLTQRQVAKSLEWSLSKVNRIEAGEVTVSSTDLQALLRLFDITDAARVAELTAEARASRRRGWWDQPQYREHLTPALIQELQYETDATAIRSFQPTFLPGPLQTPAYAAAIISLWSDELSDPDRAIRAQVRGLRREQLFGRPDPPAYRLILDESVLLREVGGPRVVSDQFADLLGLARSGRLTLRIVPLAHAAAYAIGGFTIYSSDDEDVALYRESHLADEMVYAPDIVHRHRRIFDQMWEHCLGTEASIRRIEARAAALRSVLDDTGG